VAGAGAAVGVACGAQEAATAPTAAKALSSSIFRREIFLISILLNNSLNFCESRWLITHFFIDIPVMCTLVEM
jgi:hypothetical protein